MNESTGTKWFKAVAYTALVWNILGLIQFLAHILITEEQLLAMPVEEQLLITTMPDWVNVAFAVAVVFGVLASIALVMRKALALHLYLVSMLGILVQNYYSFFMSNAAEVMGNAAYAIPSFVFVIGAYLIWYSLKAKSNGWII